jgi:hypothetical protein
VRKAAQAAGKIAKISRISIVARFERVYCDLLVARGVPMENPSND